MARRGSFLLRLSGDLAVPADAVALALPAPAAAGLLHGLVPDVAAALACIRYLDMAVVNLVYVGQPWRLPGSGFLAAGQPARLISGCTSLSGQVAAPGIRRVTLVRVTVGGRGGSAGSRWMTPSSSPERIRS